jgi:hypothetical protein
MNLHVKTETNRKMKINMKMDMNGKVNVDENYRCCCPLAAKGFVPIVRAEATVHYALKRG